MAAALLRAAEWPVCYGFERKVLTMSPEEMLDTSLNKAMAALTDRFKIPREIIETIRNSMNALHDQGLAPGLDVGVRAPRFQLLDAAGEDVSLAERLEQGPVVLSFYRGDWCPYCNLELRALQQRLGAIRALGASLIAVSPQMPRNALSLVEKHHLDFDVLSDPLQQVIARYKLLFSVPEPVRKIYRDLGLDLTQRTADKSWNLPVPATFIIGRDGIIRARHVSLNYTVRMEPGDIVDMLKRLHMSQAA